PLSTLPTVPLSVDPAAITSSPARIETCSIGNFGHATHPESHAAALRNGPIPRLAPCHSRTVAPRTMTTTTAVVSQPRCRGRHRLGRRTAAPNIPDANYQRAVSRLIDRDN